MGARKRILSTSEGDRLLSSPRVWVARLAELPLPGGSPRQRTFAVPSQWSRIEGGKAFLTLSFRGEFLWHFL